MSAVRKLGAIRRTFSAFGDVLGVRIAASAPAPASMTTSFYLGQIGNHGGHKRYAPPPGKVSGHTTIMKLPPNSELSLMLIRILAGRHCTPALRMSGVKNLHESEMR